MLISAKSWWKTGLLYCVLDFAGCFVFRMKCVIMFYKGKKKQRWARAKGRLSSERKQSLELKIIHYFFFQQTFITDLLCDLFLC